MLQPTIRARAFSGFLDPKISLHRPPDGSCGLNIFRPSLSLFLELHSLLASRSQPLNV